MASVATLRDLTDALIEASLNSAENSATNSTASSMQQASSGDWGSSVQSSEAVSNTGGTLPRVIEDLEAFFDILRTHDFLRKALTTSAFKVEERKQVAHDIGTKAGFLPSTVNFLGLVIELGNINGLLKSAQPILRKLRKASGQTRAEITVASALADDDLRRIRQTLSSQIEGDLEVVVNIDSEILGGVIAQIGDKVYDGSLRTELRKLKGTLSG